jgi:3-methyladenine DNA glycosylase AlkD
MKTLLNTLRSELAAKADPVWKAGAERYFKAPVQFYGMSNSAARKIGSEYYKQLKGLTKNEILAFCEELMRTGLMEETIIACNWSNRVQRQFEPGDFTTFERWISDYVNNWAACDTLCNHTVAEFIMKYPEFLAELKRFTQSQNRWMRRAAAVTLIIPAARGNFLADIFEIATLLLLDPDDLVRKGYGWMLKSAAGSHRQEVFEFVLRHKATMPRTALRYAIEKMPGEMKAEAMNIKSREVNQILSINKSIL